MKKIELMELKIKEQLMGKGFSAFKYSLIFIFGGVIGVIYEELLALIRTGSYEMHRGVIFFPFNPLYGFGFVILVLVLTNIEKWYHKLTYGSLLLGGLEYFASLAEEIATGKVSWDYTNHLTNIDGRTTVLFALFWGTCATLFVIFIYPHILRFIIHIYKKPFIIAVRIIMALLIFDMIFSYTALILCSLRESGYKNQTYIGDFFEKYFPEKVINKFFTNWK